MIDARALGSQCDLCPLKGREPVPPKYAASHPRLIVLAERPGAEEELRGEPLVGETGQFFEQILEYLGIPLEEIHKTNAFLCQPPWGTLEPDLIEAQRCCHPRLVRELAPFEGKVPTILAYGKYAVRAANGGAKQVSDYFGPPIPATALGLKFDVIASYHPAFALPHRSPQYGGVVTEFTRRAWAHATEGPATWEWSRTVTDVDGEAAVLEAIEQLYKAPHAGVDVETTKFQDKKREQHELQNWGQRLYNVGAASRQLGIAVSSTWYAASSRVKEAWMRWLDSDVPKVMQWGNFDARIFHINHILLRNYAIDTGVLHSLTHPRQSHDLGYCSALAFPGAPRWKDEFHLGRSNAFDDPTLEPERATYNAHDCEIQDALADEGLENLKSVPNGESVFAMMMGAWRVGIEMWKWGVHVDADRLLALRVPIEDEVKLYDLKCRELAERVGFKYGKAEYYNFNNHHHTRALFEESELRTHSSVKNDSGGFSYNEEALLLLKEKGGITAELSQAILDAREWFKRLMYVRDPPIWKDGRIRPQWAPCRAATLRWSCPGFPVQTIPKRSKEGKKLRTMYKPAPGMFFAIADYEQQEARFEALYSGEVELYEAFSKGINPYSVVASKLFGGRVSDHPKGTPSYDCAKIAFLALIYGVSDPALLEQMRAKFPKTDILKVAKVRNRFFSGMPAIQKYMTRIRDEAYRDDAVVETMSGYTYPYFGQVSPEHAYNFKNQSGGAVLMNKAIVNIYNQLGPDEKIVLSVHDEIVLEGPDPRRLVDLLKACMETEISYDGRVMRFPVEISWCDSTGNWGETKPERELPR